MKKKIKQINLEKSKGLVFPLTHDLGIRFRTDFVKFKRAFLSKKWQYFTFIFATVAIFNFVIIFNLYTQIKAATYGFNQSNWSSGVDTGSVAIHDNDQDEYKKYYSKDNNIVLLNSGEDISLLNSSTTIIETDANDFNYGTGITWRLDTSDGELKMITGNYYDANGVCTGFDDFGVFGVDSNNMTPAAAISFCQSQCPTCDLPSQTELDCICNNQISFGDNFNLWYWSKTPGGFGYYGYNFDNCIISGMAGDTAYGIRCVRR